MLRDILLALGSFVAVIIGFLYFIGVPLSLSAHDVAGLRPLSSFPLCRPGTMTELLRDIEVKNKSGELVKVSEGSAVHVIEIFNDPEVENKNVDGPFHRVEIFIAEDKNGSYVGAVHAVDVPTRDSGRSPILACAPSVADRT